MLSRKDACQQSPDNVATMIACYLCNDNNAYAISRRTPPTPLLLLRCILHRSHILCLWYGRRALLWVLFLFKIWMQSFAQKLSGVTCYWLLRKILKLGSIKCTICVITEALTSPIASQIPSSRWGSNAGTEITSSLTSFGSSRTYCASPSTP